MEKEQKITKIPKAIRKRVKTERIINVRFVKSVRRHLKRNGIRRFISPRSISRLTYKPVMPIIEAYRRFLKEDPEKNKGLGYETQEEFIDFLYSLCWEYDVRAI